MREKKNLPNTKRHKATDIDLKFPQEYSNFLEFLLTRETAEAIDQVKSMVPKTRKTFTEVRLALDSTKGVNALEKKIDEQWDKVQEAIFQFINSPYDPDLRAEFQSESSKLSGLSNDAIDLINKAYDFSPETKSRLLAKVETLVSSQAGDLKKAITLQYQTAVDSSEADDVVAQEMVSALADVVDGAITTVGPLIVSGQTINDGRDDGADSVSDDVESFTFTNGSPVTAVCTELAEGGTDGVGYTFAPDDPNKDKFQPPLHYNCDSYYTINMIGQDNPEIDTSDPVLSKEAQRNINLSDCCGHHEPSEHGNYLLNEWKTGKPAPKGKRRKK